ncbi:MAG TPA: PHP domain-containing protein, partial [Dehalococcoidia bacterium]|nr:PHP domain-containing protein [Dehalococcoidia bacterium]
MDRTHAPYVELHLHTNWSLLEGASFVDEIVGAAASMGYRALALTDHDNLFGAMEFARTARAAGILPITGAELTMEDGSHLTLLAETRAGYGNLCRLISIANGHGQATQQLKEERRLEPRLPFAALAEHTS